MIKILQALHIKKKSPREKIIQAILQAAIYLAVFLAGYLAARLQSLLALSFN